MIANRRAILALLTALNFLNFVDRAVIAAVVAPMSRELALSDFEAGLLNSAFLIGYFATSPLFGLRADKRARKGMMALGIVAWSLATMASGLAPGLATLLAARIVCGVGEASFIVLAPTIIDDLVPAERRGTALSLYFLAMAPGYAMGYILGGYFAAVWDWRTAFLLTGGPGLFLALVWLRVAEPPRKLADARARLRDGLAEILRAPLFRRAVLGYTAYTAAVGAFAFWAPSFLVKQYPGLALDTANLWFGVVLLGAGTIGTLIGGWWGDRTIARLPRAAPGAGHDAPEHRAAINVLLRVSAIGMVVAAPLTVVLLYAPTPAAFFAVAVVVEVGLSLSISPIHATVMRAVPTERRAGAMAATMFAIHLFGDLWSAAALGLLQDHLPSRIAMLALPIVFAGSACVWWPRRREAAARAAHAPVELPTADAHPA